MKRMVKLLIAVTLLAAGAMLVTQCRRSSETPGSGEHQHEYFCPMHPQIVQDKPGTCPICSMKLERREKAPARPAAPAGGGSTRQQYEYYCPMHPQVVRDKPGDCPICSMKLERREKAGTGPTKAPGERKIVYYRNPMDPSIHSQTPAKDDMGMDYIPVYEDEVSSGPAVQGRVPVDLGPEKRQLLGIRSEPVREAEVDTTLRTVGRVAVDETHIHHHHAKFEGYVERLHVDFTGQLVKKGQPLLAIYSPDLVSTQQEYLLAYEAQERFAQSKLPAVAQGGKDMLESARRRLLLWDVRPADIERLAKTGEVRRTLDLHAEVGGYVLEKAAFHGMRVTPMDTLFKIADLSHVWVLADLYEHQLPTVTLGSRAEVTTASHPGRKWTGPVTFISPVVEPSSRTVKVRVNVANPDLALKPDMFADVALHSAGGKSLVIPESAVVETGERQLVFVDRPDGMLEPREVTLGARTRDGVQVTEGVSAGEKVVTSANFLLDSESSMKAALSAAPSAAGTPGAGHQGATQAPSGSNQ